MWQVKDMLGIVRMTMSHDMSGRGKRYSCTKDGDVRIFTLQVGDSADGKISTMHPFSSAPAFSNPKDAIKWISGLDAMSLSQGQEVVVVRILRVLRARGSVVEVPRGPKRAHPAGEAAAADSVEPTSAAIPCPAIDATDDERARYLGVTLAGWRSLSSGNRDLAEDLVRSGSDDGLLQTIKDGIPPELR